VEGRRQAIFSPHSYFCSFFIQVTPSIEAGESGAPPATRNDPEMTDAAAADISGTALK
jgi:hypothetical protein